MNAQVWLGILLPFLGTSLGAAMSEHPDHTCEVFMLVEVLEDYYCFHEGQYVLQRDSYDFEDDYFAMADDERIRAICWCELEYPEVPDIYKGKTETMRRILSRPIR